MCINISSNIHVYTYIYIYTHIHVYIYIYIHEQDQLSEVLEDAVEKTMEKITTVNTGLSELDKLMTTPRSKLHDGQIKAALSACAAHFHPLLEAINDLEAMATAFKKRRKAAASSRSAGRLPQEGCRVQEAQEG